jgi:integrase
MSGHYPVLRDILMASLMAGGVMARGGKLNPMQVKKLTEPGRYGDGAGLWLQVRSPDNRSWLLRYMIAGKPRWLGLGDETVVSLAMARHKAAKARIEISNGLDPLDVKRAEQAARKKENAAKTFGEVMELFLTSQEPGWKNDKHRSQWRNTLETYVTPTIGKARIDAVTTDQVVTILEPIWLTKTETASRVRGRIESILSFATARGWRTGENPARWRGHLDQILAPKNKVGRVEHHAALDWRDMPNFMGRLAAEEGMSALAFRFAILTAARTGEVIGARWAEVNLEEKVWTVPAARMKAGREHRVPLSEAALAVLEAAKALQRDDGFIFPGKAKGKPLSNMALLMTLRRMERPDLTAHGFRSTFRDWCAENTNFPREVAEAALAHVNKDKVESAYLRGDHFARRRELMAAWASHAFETY